MNGFALNNIQNAYVGSTPAQAIYLCNQLIWPTGPHDYSHDYLTITSLADNNYISWRVMQPVGSNYSKTIYISTNNGSSWTSYTSSSSTSGTHIAILNTGDKMLIKGYNNYYGYPLYGQFNYGNYFISSNNFNVSGNIMSLVYGDNFISQTSLPADYTFATLFYDCSHLISAENLILPATTLTQGCYSNMFRGCTSLSTAPELPATTLAQECYMWMFHGCTALTTAPELPATTLANSCYANMFGNCISLTTAPELPAPTLVSECYYCMFTNSYSDISNSALNYIKCLATDISASNCTTGWVQKVAASGTFVKDASMTSWTTGVSGIPSGWVVEPHDYSLDYLTFEALESGDITWKAIGTNSPAKTISYSINDGAWTSISSSSAGTNISVSSGDKVRLKGNESSYASSNSIYSGFENQSGAKFNVYGNIMSLIYGDNFIGQTSFNGGTYNLCSIFKKSCVVSAENLILPATTLTQHCYRAMFSNATLLEKAPALPATTLAQRCYYYMFENTKITTAPALPATTLANYCYFSMFRGCASLTTAPALPATTLADYCYQYMFSGCSSLTTAPDLPATTLKRDCYVSMFYGCSSLNYIKCLTTDGSVYGKTNWVDGVAASGTFVKDANTRWTTGVNGIPSGWTVQNA